jgi:hypothetical protein
MTAPVPPSEVARDSSVDWDELSGLDRIISIFQIGPSVVVVETTDNREIKISAWFDRRTGHYVADFEKRCTLSNAGKQLRVWAHTPAYPRCVAEDLVGCLETAILEVDRLPVY